jgi:DNA transposition AAA+ family ATPase
MKGNYITYHVLRACQSHKKITGKDIYSKLAETIAERKKILPRFEALFLDGSQKAKNDIHCQLAETLAERKRILQRLHQVLSVPIKDCLILHNQKAA